jgi:phosphopentomutase
MPFRRVVILLLDSVGAGEMPDAAAYGDAGADTLGHVAALTPGFALPNFARLGLGNLHGIPGVGPVERPQAHFGRMSLKSPGKDTTTGHWEIAGVVLEQPFSTWPQGFSPEILEEFTRRTGRGVLGNCAASGTEILKDLGAEHLRSGKLIVYTSADSVFQVAAHEGKVPLDELYRACEIARDILDRHRVARVIARPFVGDPGHFQRTYNRRDYSLLPPHATLLDLMQQAGVPVIGIGKIQNIFAERGVDVSIHTEGNTDGIAQTIQAMREHPEGLIFTNLVDFDMQYGHRRDVPGYARALTEVDDALPAMLQAAGEGTLFVITADHGCDPSYAAHTDHTREHVPLLAWHAGLTHGRDLGLRASMADLGQSIAHSFGLRLPAGESFLSDL